MDFRASGGEFKWVVFTPNKRASVGKLVALLKGQQGFIKSLSLIESLRGAGISLFLLEACKKYLKEECGCGYVELDAEEDMTRFKKLVDYYRRAGFQETVRPVRMLYNGDDTYRVVSMRCYLSLTALMQEKSIGFWEALLECEHFDSLVTRVVVAKVESHPEWLQFMVLIHGMGIPNSVLRQTSLPPIALDIMEGTGKTALRLLETIKRLVAEEERKIEPEDISYARILVDKYSNSEEWKL